MVCFKPFKLYDFYIKLAYDVIKMCIFVKQRITQSTYVCLNAHAIDCTLYKHCKAHLVFSGIN